MAYVKVGNLSTLPPDSVMEAVVGLNSYAICNIQGQLYALDGTCPHAGGPLGQGMLTGNALMCPWHAYEFDPVTGENLDNPLMRVEKVPVKVEGDDILIEVA
jgi:nitrite reductase/ring-hydroxylating ferredoxin subunit